MAVTIRDVAGRAYVAPITVSRYLNDPDAVALPTRTRIGEAIVELGYLRSAARPGAPTAQVKMIAHVLRDGIDGAALRQMRAVDDAVGRAGHIVVFSGAGDRECEGSRLQSLVDRRVDGVIMSSRTDDAGLVRLVLRRGLPVSSISPVGRPSDADSVCCDIAVGMRSLVAHLAGLGHRRIRMVCGAETLASSVELAHAYRAAMAEVRLPAMDPVFGDSSTAGGDRLAGSMLDRTDRPTAVITADVLLAVGVVRAARALQIVVPDGLSVATVEDSADGRKDPFFTRIAPPIELMAQTAAGHLFDRLTRGYRGPARSVALPATLEVFSSSARMS